MQQTIFLLRILLAFIITIIATVQDLKSYKIKNELIIVAFATGGMCTVLNLLWGGDVKSYIYGEVVGFTITFILFLIRAIGAGDAKLLTMVGFIVGYQIIIKIILVSLICGAFIGLLSILLRKYTSIRVVINKEMSKYNTIPFSPAILMAQIIVFVMYLTP